MNSPIVEPQSFSASTASLAGIRAYAQERAVALGFGARSDDVVLVASELATNAISATDARDVELTMRSDGERLELVVVNRSPSAPPTTAPPIAEVSTTATSGRGLAIVDALSDELVIEHHRDTVTVTASFVG